MLPFNIIEFSLQLLTGLSLFMYISRTDSVAGLSQGRGTPGERVQTTHAEGGGSTCLAASDVAWSNDHRISRKHCPVACGWVGGGLCPRKEVRSHSFLSADGLQLLPQATEKTSTHTHTHIP